MIKRSLLFLQDTAALSLRVEGHCQNSLATVRSLEDHPQVNWVSYPGLETSKSHHTAKKYMKNGFGSVILFGIKGGRKEGEKFIESLKIFSHLANVGDAKSFAIHPASTTHSQLSSEQLATSGITDSMIRLSTGIEHIEDIKDDLQQAIAAATT